MVRDSLPTLSYATPERRWRLPEWLRGPLAFWAAGLIAAMVEQAVDIYGPLQDWNSYLGADWTALAAALVAVFYFTLATAMMVLFIEIILWMLPRFERRASYVFWIVMGLCFGLACTLPYTIDVALSDRHRNDGGNLNTQGWGDRAAMICFFGMPALTVLLALRRRRLGRGTQER